MFPGSCSTEAVTLAVSPTLLLSLNLPRVFYAYATRLLMMMLIIVGPGVLWGTLLLTEHQEAGLFIIVL